MIAMIISARDRFVDAVIGWLTSDFQDRDEHAEHLGIGGAANSHDGAE